MISLLITIAKMVFPSLMMAPDAGGQVKRPRVSYIYNHFSKFTER